MADLFSPVKLGAIELRNRMVMAPLTRNRAGYWRRSSRLKRDILRAACDSWVNHHGGYSD